MRPLSFHIIASVLYGVLEGNYSREITMGLVWEIWIQDQEGLHLILMEVGLTMCW